MESVAVPNKVGMPQLLVTFTNLSSLRRDSLTLRFMPLLVVGLTLRLCINGSELMPIVREWLLLVLVSLTNTKTLLMVSTSILSILAYLTIRLAVMALPPQAMTETITLL
jgi:hypothetical protein